MKNAPKKKKQEFGKFYKKNQVAEIFLKKMIIWEMARKKTKKNQWFKKLLNKCNKRSAIQKTSEKHKKKKTGFQKILKEELVSQNWLKNKIKNLRNGQKKNLKNEWFQKLLNKCNKKWEIWKFLNEKSGSRKFAEKKLWKIGKILSVKYMKGTKIKVR